MLRAEADEINKGLRKCKNFRLLFCCKGLLVVSLYVVSSLYIDKVGFPGSSRI